MRVLSFILVLQKACSVAALPTGPFENYGRSLNELIDESDWHTLEKTAHELLAAGEQQPHVEEVYRGPRPYQGMSDSDMYEIIARHFGEQRSRYLTLTGLNRKMSRFIGSPTLSILREQYIARHGQEPTAAQQAEVHRRYMIENEIVPVGTPEYVLWDAILKADDAASAEEERIRREGESTRVHRDMATEALLPYLDMVPFRPPEDMRYDIYRGATLVRAFDKMLLRIVRTRLNTAGFHIKTPKESADMLTKLAAEMGLPLMPPIKRTEREQLKFERRSKGQRQRRENSLKLKEAESEDDLVRSLNLESYTPFRTSSSREGGPYEPQTARPRLQNNARSMQQPKSSFPDATMGHTDESEAQMARIPLRRDRSKGLDVSSHQQQLHTLHTYEHQVPDPFLEPHRHAYNPFQISDVYNIGPNYSYGHLYHDPGAYVYDVDPQHSYFGLHQGGESTTSIQHQGAQADSMGAPSHQSQYGKQDELHHFASSYNPGGSSWHDWSNVD